jgi:hypothetical protein
MAIEKEKPIDSTQPPEDPYSDLTKLRLDQSFIERVGAKKVLTTVPVRKPRKQDYIRVHPGEKFREPFAVIELEDENEHYLITQPIAAAIPAEIITVMIYTAINRQKDLWLWPVRLPPSEGRQIDWHRSAQEAAEKAMKKWIRVTPNMSLRAYEITESTATPPIPEPEWLQDYSFNDLLKIAFRNRIIDSFDHPVLKRLRGEC